MKFRFIDVVDISVTIHDPKSLLYVLVKLVISFPLSKFENVISNPFVFSDTVAVAALPEQAAAVVAVAALPEHDAAVVAFVAFVALVALTALVAFVADVAVPADVAYVALVAFVALVAESACLTMPLFDTSVMIFPKMT